MKTIKQFNHLSSLSRSGFTLVEILIASGIFVMVLSMSIFTFSTSNNLASKNTVLRETSQAGRYAIEAISRDIHMARNKQGQPAFTASTNNLEIFYIDENGNANPKIYSYRCDEDEKGEERCSIYLDNEDIAPKDISLKEVEGKSIFTQIGDGLTEQPQLEINFKVINLGEGEMAKSATQTLRTSVTTRSYPGFNLP